MQKFLSIPVTGEQNQLVSCNDIKLIEQATTTTVTIAYGGGKVITLTHAAVSAGSEEMRDAIQDGVVQVLKQQWTEVILQMGSLPQAVSGIAIA
jgi:azurin